MTNIVFASICPHPPIIVPTIGQPADLKRVSKTIEAIEKLAGIFKEAGPETMIVISPHGPVSYSQMTVVASPAISGNFYNFGDFKTNLKFENDLDFVAELKKECQKNNIPFRSVDLPGLDHGTLVPLYFLAKNVPKIKVVPLAYSFLDLDTHFKFGKILQKAITDHSLIRANKRIGVIASGDLSHRLTLDAPAGYTARGRKFDEKLVEMLKEKDVRGILNMDSDLIEEAGECGFRSIITLLGCLDDLNWQPEILSYEGPFGVGYLVANFELK